MIIKAGMLKNATLILVCTANMQKLFFPGSCL